MADIPVEKPHELFEYRDGELYWKERPESDFDRPKHCASWNAQFAGKKAGFISDTRLENDYVRLGYKGKRYRVHRIIFAMHHGYYPKMVDHIDNNKSNNKIENLREADRSKNAFNTPANITNTSGYKNVYWEKQTNKWRVSFRIGKERHLKRFTLLEDAVEYAKELREKLHGDYARHE